MARSAALASAPLFVLLGYEFGADIESLMARIAAGERNVIIAIIAIVVVVVVVNRWRTKRNQAKATAADQLAESLAAFTEAGRTATGEIVDDDPLPALRAAVAGGGVREVAVVTYPHAVEDTFHTDWASRAREVLKVPVLHLYAGTSELG